MRSKNRMKSTIDVSRSQCQKGRCIRFAHLFVLTYSIIVVMTVVTVLMYVRDDLMERYFSSACFSFITFASNHTSVHLTKSSSHATCFIYTLSYCVYCVDFANKLGRRT